MVVEMYRVGGPGDPECIAAQQPTGIDDVGHLSARNLVKVRNLDLYRRVVLDDRKSLHQVQERSYVSRLGALRQLLGRVPDGPVLWSDPEGIGSSESCKKPE